LTGRYRHHLVRADEDFKISLQRVDLLNYDAPLAMCYSRGSRIIPCVSRRSLVG
jgi:hypothetical protein